MNDLISRQAAIDALCHVDEHNVRSIGAIRNLPSARPEIIYCKDCKWRENQNGSRAWLPCMALVVPNEFYCARAERRNDG